MQQAFAQLIIITLLTTTMAILLASYGATSIIQPSIHVRRYAQAEQVACGFTTFRHLRRAQPTQVVLVATVQVAHIAAA